MKLNGYLRYGVLGGLFLVPFIPFLVFNDLFFLFITSKAFAFRILIGIIAALWAVLAFRDTNYAPKRSLIVYALGTFIIIIGFADAMGVNPSKSFWSNYERMEGFVSLAYMCVYFLIASSVIKTEKIWDRLFQTSIFASAVMGIYGLLQLSGKAVIHQGGVRIDGTFGNATYLAVYMMFHIFLTVFLYVRRRGNSLYESGAYGIAVILQLIALYYTATRGAMLGLIGGVLLTTILIALFEKKSILVRKITIGIIVAMIVVIGGFFAIKNTSFVANSPVLARFSSISLNDDTTKSRFLVWEMAWKGFKDRPILGWGQENFIYVFSTYYNPQMYNQEPWFDRAHNIVFDWLIAGGLLGLLAYLSLFVASLYVLWRAKNNFSFIEKAILTGLIAGYFFQNLFVFDNLISYILFFSLLAYIHTQTYVGPSIKEGELGALREYIGPIISVVLIVWATYISNAAPIAANGTLIKALYVGGKTASGYKFYYPEGPAKNIEYFKRALGYNTFGNPEIAQQLISSLYTVAQSDAPKEVVTDFYTTARLEMLKEVEKDPKNVRTLVELGLFLERVGNFDEALVYLNKAIALSPQKQSIYFYVGQAYMNKKDFDKAIAAFKYAYELEPSYADAKTFYDAAVTYAKKAS